MSEDRTAVSADMAQLVSQHHQSVYRYAYRLTGQVADAEDLTQQTFLTAQRKIGQVRNVDKIRGWLFTVLRNCFLKSCQKRVPIPAASLELNLDTMPQPIPAAEQVDGELLQAALDQLPAEFRLVLVMFYLEECSYKEIADKLAVPLGTVMSRLSRAKEHLRRQLVQSQPPQPREFDSQSHGNRRLSSKEPLKHKLPPTAAVDGKRG